MRAGGPAIKEKKIESVRDVGPVLEEMGIDTNHPEKVEPIPKSHWNRLFRISLGGSSYVLKVFGDPHASREAGAYALLMDLGVPTLRVVARTNTAILLEDLAASRQIRLAREEDAGRAEVGVALAAWYRALHDAGSRLGTARVDLSFLWREIDELNAGSIMEVASKVGGSNRSRWATLANNIDRVKDAAKASSETLTYNDFHWTNLALSREEKSTSAVVFDYHLLGLGLRYSDYRNATGSLGPDAAAAFRSTYGETDPRERTLDDLMAPLYSLVEAFRRPRFPSWGRASLKLAEAGEIHRRFEKVLDIL